MLPLALYLIAAQAAATATTTLAPDSEARWVPFELTVANQIRFDAQLNGRPVRAILDTGLSNSIATRAHADRAGLAGTSPQAALAIGGRVRVAWTGAVTLGFGGLSQSGFRLGITDQPGQERFGAELLVGSDVLGCCALDIDYDARRFRILPSGRLPFAGESVRMAALRGSGVPVASARLGGKLLRPLIVDTGDGSSVTLSRAAWLSAGYRGARLTTTLGYGLGGEVVSEAAVVPDFALAGAAPPETELRIEGEGGFSAAAGAAGRIGSGLLARYRVLLDPGAGRMVLQPGKTFAAPALRSTSGLLLGLEGEHLRVLHVMRGSPAAEGGWRAGETICQADGAPVAARPVDWPAGSPGRTVALTLCNGVARRLTLARFY
jgi:hypothetical protein